LAQAWNAVGRVEGSMHGLMSRAEHAWERALEFSERGNFAAQKAESVSWLLVSAIFGPLPVEEGIARCRAFYEVADDPATRAFCCVEQAPLEAMRGKFERARELLADGKRGLEELGLSVWAANTAQEAFAVEMLAGNPAGAAAVLRESYETLEQMGERGFLSTVAGSLAQALCALGADDEAERYSRACEAAAAPDDVSAQVLWRASRAKVLARRGELEAAEEMVRVAVAIVEQTDLLNDQAQTLLDLSEVLRLAGRVDEARTAAAEAASLFERKGNLPSLERARAEAA